MNSDVSSAQQEFQAIATLHAALEPLEAEARSRVLAYIASLLDITGHISVKEAAIESDSDSHADECDDAGDGSASNTNFGTFAELFDAASPQTQNDMALVAGYWLQVVSGADHFNAQAASKELSNLGHKLTNITTCLTSLKSLKPALILQLRKSGKSQQARKTYKVSVAGIRRVEEMIDE